MSEPAAELERQLELIKRELGEARAQQAATSEILKVISRSAFGLRSVLQTLVESAVRLCATDGLIYLRQGDLFVAEAAFEPGPGHLKVKSRAPRNVDRSSVTGRVALSGRVEQIPDNLADPEFTVPADQRLNNIRSLVGVPLLRNGEVEGVFVLGRPEPGLFSPRQIDLVRTFADQAVIAIENVRLFEEAQRRNRELSATSEVLRVISRSPTDVQPVFEVIARSAAELCNSDHAYVHRFDGTHVHLAAQYGSAPEAAEATRRVFPMLPGRGGAGARAILSRSVEHIPDYENDSDYAFKDVAALAKVRSAVAVPMLREGEPIGAIVLDRSQVGYYPERQVELLKTFADQAAIAIENVRLFEKVKHRTDELSRSLEDLRTAQDRLIQTEKLASLGQLTAGIAHEIKNPLNFVNNFSSLSGELVDELQGLLQDAALDDRRRVEVAELTNMLKGNLDKVVQHGRRADSIVKNMLLHSRAGSGDHRPSDINAIVEEALNLAYHGARAEKQGFNITLERNLDPTAGEADLFPQEITRALLNLISNGFYAAAKRKAEADGGYEPKLTATTRNLGDRIEIKIRDNGTGIPPEVKEKMFNPFFTTKPAGEGTGLGLSLSHDIIVKQHAGTIGVETEPGAFTEFRIVLPRGAASLGNFEVNA